MRLSFSRAWPGIALAICLLFAQPLEAQAQATAAMPQTNSSGTAAILSSIPTGGTSGCQGDAMVSGTSMIQAKNCQWNANVSGSVLANQTNTAPLPDGAANCADNTASGIQCSNGIRQNAGVMNILYNYDYGAGYSNSKTCRFMDNTSGGTASKDIFVPQHTIGEYLDFLNNAPSYMNFGFCVQSETLSNFKPQSTYQSGYAITAAEGAVYNVGATGTAYGASSTVTLPAARVPSYTTSSSCATPAGSNPPPPNCAPQPGYVASPITYTRYDCLPPTSGTPLTINANPQAPNCRVRTIIETQTIEFPVIPSSNPLCTTANPSQMTPQQKAAIGTVDCDGTWGAGQVVSTTWQIDAGTTFIFIPDGLADYDPPGVCMDASGNIYTTGQTWNVTNIPYNGGAIQTGLACPSSEPTLIGATSLNCPEAQSGTYQCNSNGTISIVAGSLGTPTPVWASCNAVCCTSETSTAGSNGQGVFGQSCTATPPSMAHAYVYNINPTSATDQKGYPNPLNITYPTPPAVYPPFASYAQEMTNSYGGDTFIQYQYQGDPWWEGNAPGWDEGSGDPFSTRQIGLEFYTPSINVPLQDDTGGFPGYPNLNNWFGVCYDGTYTAPTQGKYLIIAAANNGIDVLMDATMSTPLNYYSELSGTDIISMSGEQDSSYPYPLQEEYVTLAEGPHHVVVRYWQGPPPQLGVNLWVVPAGDPNQSTIFNQLNVDGSANAFGCCVTSRHSGSYLEYNPAVNANDQALQNMLTTSYQMTLTAPASNLCPAELCGTAVEGWGQSAAPTQNLCADGATVTSAPVLNYIASTDPTTPGLGLSAYVWTCGAPDGTQSQCHSNAGAGCGSVGSTNPTCCATYSSQAPTAPNLCNPGGTASAVTPYTPTTELPAWQQSGFLAIEPNTLASASNLAAVTGSGYSNPNAGLGENQYANLPFASSGWYWTCQLSGGNEPAIATYNQSALCFASDTTRICGPTQYGMATPPQNNDPNSCMWGNSNCLCGSNSTPTPVVGGTGTVGGQNVVTSWNWSCQDNATQQVTATCSVPTEAPTCPTVNTEWSAHNTPAPGQPFLNDCTSGNGPACPWVDGSHYYLCQYGTPTKDAAGQNPIPMNGTPDFNSTTNTWSWYCTSPAVNASSGALTAPITIPCSVGAAGATVYTGD